MRDEYLAIVIFVMGFIIFCIGNSVLLHNVQTINNDIDFYQSSHLVKIHIYPEKEGMSVAAWASDKFPPTTGRTDNNSEVTFPMVSSARYNILIDDNRCSYYIYPVGAYYNISCGDVK